ncbi:hypothetical protein QYF36_007762 [Acer negundo]|nr:hypothetical protein QYF36_007762 [Acer negundo]
MRGLRASTTTSDTTLNTVEPLRRTTLNRLFAAVYTCAILTLLFHHAQTLLFQSKTLLSFSISLSLLVADMVLAFMWSTTQSFRMRPVHRREYPENLKKVTERNKFPGLDVFICTADPNKEPPMGVVNTALSVMAYDYPTEKISVYVSDDGGSAFTLFAFMEAAKFASHWLPFCRKKDVMERNPDAYFASNHSWNSETEKIKMMYESMKMRVEHVVETGKVSDEYITSDQECEAFHKWTDRFTRQDHPTVIQVLLESSKDKDITGNYLPNLVYVSREKSKTSHHYFKAGALNVMLRVSATMSNAPIVLTLDCDMYSNDPETPLRALCYVSDPNIGPNLAYVQFPQRFRGINKNDIYASEFKRLFELNPIGFDGLRGPNYLGTGAFFRRRAFFGDPSTFIAPEIVELSLDHAVEESIKSPSILSLAHRVSSCNYENQTNWGSKLALLNGVTIFPKVSEPLFFLYTFLFLGAYGQEFLDFVLEGETFGKWWNDQRIWMIKGLSSYLFGFTEYLLNSLGISALGFNVTSKVVDDELGKRYDQEIFEFGAPSPMFVPIIMAAILNFFSFSWGLLKIIRGVGDMQGQFLQMLLSGFVMVNCWPIYEAIVFRSDKGKLPTKVTVIATFLAWALYYTATSLIFK